MTDGVPWVGVLEGGEDLDCNTHANTVRMPARQLVCCQGLHLLPTWDTYLLGLG